jgi:hypothetical protein
MSFVALMVGGILIGLLMWAGKNYFPDLVDDMSHPFQSRRGCMFWIIYFLVIGAGVIVLLNSIER